MTLQVAIMLVLIGLALFAFIREIFPIEVTAMALLAAVLLLGFIEPSEAFMGFSNKAVVTIGALFVLSDALMRTGLLEAAAERLSRELGHRRWLGIAVFLFFVAILSGLLNNTAIVAMTIPLVTGLSRRLQVSPSKVLIPLSYASIFGGTLTLIGTSTNILVSSILEQSARPPISMFELTPLGLILLVIGLTYTLLAAPRLLPARVEAQAMTGKYGLGRYLTEVQVLEDSPLIGTSCRDAKINDRYGTTVLAILRGGKRHIQQAGTLELRAEDILIVQGGMEDLMRLRSEEKLALLPDIKLSDAELSSGGLVMAEAIVPPTSPVIGRNLKQIDFRQRFGGFVLAIRRVGGTLREKIAQARLQALDSLLMLVPTTRLEELRRSEDLALVSELEVSYRRHRRWWWVLVLLPAVVLMAAVGVLDIAVGAGLAMVLLLMAKVTTPQQAYRSIEWSVIFLIAAFVPVGQAIINTGTAQFLADSLLRVGGLFDPDWAPWVVLSAVYLVTSLMTQMVSNNAAAIIIAPVALTLGSSLGVDSRPFVIAVCFAASAEFMTPMGYQTNLMVYGPGGYRFGDYTRFGAPLNLLFWVLATLLIPRIWPF